MTPAPAAVSIPQSTILLAEDEDAVRDVVHMVLTKNGYIVLSARNGAEALDLFAKHADAIELVITDIVMPEMSGYELVNQLVAAKPGLKVIFMSGYAAGELIPQGLGTHQAGHLHKPFAPGDLTQLTEQALRTT